MTTIVYKYVPEERLTYLEDELIRITQPGDLNDPFELMPVIPSESEIINILRQAYNELIEDNNRSKLPKNKRIENRQLLMRRFKSDERKMLRNEPDSLKNYFFNNSKNNINSNLGIISMSRKWENALMWAHYSNSHKGFCIGFNSDDPFFSRYKKLSDSGKMFMPVVYTDSRIKVPIEKGDKIDFQILYTKSNDWKYENEERLIIQLNLATKRIHNDPYDICLYRVPHNLVKEIVVGMNISDVCFDRVKQFCIEKGIDLYKCKISDYTFNMERQKILLLSNPLVRIK